MSDFTSNLPEEVLAGCFDGLRLRDVISASHVSRYWRSTSIAFPALWTHIDIGGTTGDPAKLVHMAISRAGQLPVDFEFVQLIEWIPTTASEVTSQYMHRFRTFNWISAMSFLDVTLPAPLLQEFSCSDNRSFIPTDFLGGVCGILRSLTLTEARFAPECPALTSVVHLRASYPWDSDNVTGTDFSRLFDLCPNLETMHLRHLLGVPGHELPAGPAPRTLKQAKLKAHANCDLLKVYDAWKLSSIPRVRLTMRLGTPLDISPLVQTADSVYLRFEGRKVAHIFAYLSDAREHVLSLSNLGPHSTLALAQILRGAAGLTQIQTLHLPLNVLAPLVFDPAPFVLPQLAKLTVYVAEDDPFDTHPYLDNEPRQAFQWTSLRCLGKIPRCFPRASVPVLVVQKANREAYPSLDDAQGLLAFLSAPGNCTLREVHVEGFPEDVTRTMRPPLDSDCPQVVFSVGAHETFVAHPSAYSGDV